MIFIARTLIRWRKFIISASLVTAGVMAAVSFILPRWYRAGASVFPPETSGFMPDYSEIIQSLQLPIIGPSAVGPRPGTIYIDIMLSRKVGEKLLDEFDLKNVYGTQLTMEAVDQLHSHTDFSLLDNGLLKISFEDRDPERAAAVTNRYIELLDEFNKELKITRASKTKEFIEGQMELHSVDLREAEEALKRFQQENQALELDEQVRSSIEMVAGLTAEAITLEVDLAILRQYTSQSSQEYVHKKNQYDEIIKQLGKFKDSSARDEDDLIHSFFPAFENVPEVGLHLARLIRRVKIEEKVFEMLIKEFEKARIEEARDTPTVQVLDRAVVPELRSRPKRKMLVVMGGIVGLGWSALLAVFVTIWREEPERFRFLRDILAPVGADLNRILRRKS